MKVQFDIKFDKNKADAGAGLTSPLIKRIKKIKWKKRGTKRY
jgi:hypothetical protein